MFQPSHTVALVGAIVVSFIVLLGFVAVCLALFFRAIPAESHDVAVGMFGSLGTMAMGVVSFWIGTSIGSQRKDFTRELELRRGGNDAHQP